MVNTCAVTPSQIRDAFASAILGIASPTWRLSPHPYAFFGRDAVTTTHLSFVVMPLTFTAEAGRQRPGEGIWGFTEVGIKYLYRLRSAKRITDLDAGLDAEVALGVAIGAMPSLGWSTPRRMQTPIRTTIGENNSTFLVEARWGVRHHAKN